MSTPNNPGEYPTYPSGPQYGGPSYGGQMGQPMYGGQMMPPPQKKSRKGLWITLGVIAGVLVLACGGIGFVFFSAVQEALKPVTAATTFCNDLKTQNYTAAYGLLSSGAQAKATQDQFTQVLKLQDQVDGTVKSCAPATGNSADAKIDINAGKATLKSTVQRNQAFTGNIILVKQGSDWKVDDVDQSLQGRNLEPIIVANTFCQALVSGDFHTAYTQLSANQQKQGTEAEFKQQITDGFSQGGIQITLKGCTPNFTSYTVSDTTATLESTLDISAAGTSVSAPITLSFVKENEVWKIDSLDAKSN